MKGFSEAGSFADTQKRENPSDVAAQNYDNDVAAAATSFLIFCFRSASLTFSEVHSRRFSHFSQPPGADTDEIFLSQNCVEKDRVSD